MGRARGQKREFCVLLAIEREAPGAILLVAAVASPGKRGAVDEARRRGELEWRRVEGSGRNAPCTFALRTRTPHTRRRRRPGDVPCNHVPEAKQWEAPALEYDGTVVHFSCVPTGRCLEAQCCGAGPPPGVAWEVGLPRAEAELSSLFVALAPSDWDRGTQRKSNPTLTNQQGENNHQHQESPNRRLADSATRNGQALARSRSGVFTEFAAGPRWTGLDGAGKPDGHDRPFLVAPNHELGPCRHRKELPDAAFFAIHPSPLPPQLSLRTRCAFAAPRGRFGAWNLQPPGKPIQLYFGPHAALHYLVCTSVLRASRETLIPDHDSYPQRYHASRRTPRSCRPVVRGAGAAQRGLDPPDVNGLRNIHGSPDDCCLSH
ncbi:hypothetical protein BGZ57DRAFT_848877 [Hyaloscypha finlandica]|nr:hypothetical protein BGZ57DRAFT_848877 [Hyaloscypha finlandica]